MKVRELIERLIQGGALLDDEVTIVVGSGTEEVTEYEIQRVDYFADNVSIYIDD